MLDRKTGRRRESLDDALLDFILYLLYDHVQKGFTTTPHSRYRVDTISALSFTPRLFRNLLVFSLQSCLSLFLLCVFRLSQRDLISTASSTNAIRSLPPFTLENSPYFRLSFLVIPIRQLYPFASRPVAASSILTAALIRSEPLLTDIH